MKPIFIVTITLRVIARNEDEAISKAYWAIAGPDTLRENGARLMDVDAKQVSTD